MNIGRIVVFICLINLLLLFIVIAIIIVAVGGKQLVYLPDKFVPLFYFIIGGAVSLIASKFQ